jgi:hypothetical protein
MAGADTDQAFALLANKAGGIKPLLDSFFGFLNRKTDFYIQFDENDKNPTMGFPEDGAQKMVMDSFLQYSFTDYASTQQKSKPTANQTTIQSSKPTSTEKVQVKVKKEKKTVSPVPTPALTDEGKQVPIGNGGIADNYYWTQSLNELTTYVDVDSELRGKDVKCVIAPKSLSLEVHGKSIVTGPLEDVVNTSESMWTISSSKGTSQIVISLEKTRKTWWKHVIVGHPEIDTSKVDSTQKIDEYDESTQATIRKLMFEQKQRRLNGAGGTQMESSSLLPELPPRMLPPGVPLPNFDNLD